MVLLQAALGLVLIAVCSFWPGFFLVRRLRWSGMEKLCGSIALSLILLWLAAWSLYVFAPGRAAAWLITAACAGLAAASWRDAAALFRIARVRRAVAGFGFLLLWTLVLLSIIRNYSGATWRGDWLEHFQRTLFFLHHFPRDIEIVGNYSLPARPPAMNVLAAFVLAQAGDRFEVMQAVFAFLNLLLFLPCVMALPVLARPRRPGIVAVVGIFAASPVIMQNTTYTWTKALPAFFVVLAILVYLMAWRTGDSMRMVFAFAALSMGLLAHYSAGPYIAFLALHYLLVVFAKRKARWKELALIAGSSAALLGTWFGWSAAVYGFQATVASNTSVTTSREYTGHNLEKIAANLIDSSIPPIVRDPEMVNAFPQPNAWGWLRDQVFVTYQQNLIFCMGALAGFAAWGLAIAALRKRMGAPGERTFWIGLLVWSVVVGIAVVGERDPLGVAHLTLLPMAGLGMTLVASRYAASRALAWAVMAGFVVDFSLGVYLQARIEHLENTPERTIFAGLEFRQGQIRPGASADSLNPSAWENWMRKHEHRLAEEWGRSVRELQANDPGLEPARADALQGMARMEQADARLWRGWYQRHGGEIGFLGDQFGSGDATSAVLLPLAAGLLWKMRPARRAVKAAPPPKRKKR